MAAPIKTEMSASEMATESKVPSDHLQRSDAASDQGVVDEADDTGMDPALHLKILCVNEALDTIGWTGYHWKLFFLTGFGYTMECWTVTLQAIITMQAFLELAPGGYRTALTMSTFVGLITGSLFWGFFADMIGRKIAFNICLFICSIACIVAGAMPKWEALAFWIAILGFGGGGGLILDSTLLLEFLPSRKRWVVTVLGVWWGVGQTVAGFVAWPFLTPLKWNCQPTEACTYADNPGWRYTMYTSGAIVFVMSCLRITVIRLKETPKFQLAANNDEAVVNTLRTIATKYNRPFSLTVEQLQSCGMVNTAHAKKRIGVAEILVHVRGLFATRKLILSTVLLWCIWAMIGLAAPLFLIFLPYYLAARGANIAGKPVNTWRDFALTSIAGIFGPLLAGYLCNIRVIGRRYTISIAAFLTMIFFFAYIGVRTPASNDGLTAAINFALNMLLASLYAYTAEVMPAAHRTTGYSIGYAITKVMGIVCALIGASVDPTSTVPIFLCASLLGAVSILSMFLPFEPRLMKDI